MDGRGGFGVWPNYPRGVSGRDKDTRLDFLKEEIRVAKLLDHPTLGPQRARTARGNGGFGDVWSAEPAVSGA